MKKYILSILLSMLLLPCAQAQQYIDSLRYVLQIEQADTARVRRMNDLAWALKDHEPASAQEVALSGIHLAEKVLDKKGAALLYKTSGVIYYYTSEYKRAEQQLQTALTHYQLLADQKGVANVLNNLGLTAQAKGNHKEAIEYLEKSANIRDQIGDQSGRANSLTNIGIMHMMAGEYEQALQKHLNALRIWESLDHYIGNAFSHMNIGRVHFLLDQYNDAEHHFNRAYEIHLVLENPRGQADAYSNLGDIFMKRNQQDKAIHYFRLALGLREQLTDKTGIRESLSKIGEAKFQLKEIPEAIYHYKRALHIAEQTQEKQGMVLLYNLLGEAHTENKEPEVAIRLLAQGILLSQELGTQHDLSKAYLLTSQAYKQLGNHKQALTFMELYVSSEDKILNETVYNNTRIMKADYEKQVQEKEIEIRETEQTLRELRKNKLIFQFSAFFLGLMVLYLFYRYRFKSRIAQVLAAQKQEIETQNLALAMSNSDLEQFAYAVSHDLKQPLRTIGSFSSLIAKRYDEHLDEDGHQFIKYVTDGVSHMHDLLSDILVYSQVGGQDHPETLDLNLAISEALQNLEHLIRTEKAQIEIDVLPIVLGHHSGMVRIFQNLIHNGIKFHGTQTPRIEITYTNLSNDHLIAIKDNGIGIEPAYLKKIFVLFQRLHTQDDYPGTGIGLAICQKITWQHGGKLWVESTHQEGSIFYIKLPKDHFKLDHT